MIALKFLFVFISISLIFICEIPLNLRSNSFFIYIMINAVVLVYWFTKNEKYNTCYIDVMDDIVDRKFIFSMLTIILFALIYFFSVNGFFYHSSYNSQILANEKKPTLFTKVTVPTDKDQIRVVTKSMASSLADKKIGELGAIGSTFEVGNFTIQKVKTKLYWVAPLEFNDFFSWLNTDYSSVVMMVSATDPNDVVIVKDLKMTYLSSAFFGHDIKRHYYFDNMSKLRDDFTFELDDNLKPYIVATVYENTIGLSGSEAIGVDILDVQTGEIKFYSLKDVPAWVDRVQPEDFIIDQVNNHGEFIQGYQFFSSVGKFKVSTKEISLMFDSVDSTKWVGSITSTSNSDKSIIGIFLVDSKTKEYTLLNIGGITEQAAQQAAEGKIQQYRYKATQPTIYNIGGKPTYVMSMLDANGYYKMLAMVNIENVNIVAVSDNISDTYQLYLDQLSSTAQAFSPDSIVKSESVTGTIVRISDDIKKGDLYKYLMIKGVDNKVFYGTSSVSKELILSRLGDEVTINYQNGGNGFVNIQKFDNLDIDLETSISQKIKTKDFEKLKTTQAIKEDSKVADVEWNSLTDEQKANMLNNLQKK